MGDLGKFWGDLGKSWGGLGAILDPQGPRLLYPWGALGSPKRHQNRLKNDAKTKRKFKSEKNRSKTIWDPSWGDLGSFWQNEPT